MHQPSIDLFNNQLHDCVKQQACVQHQIIRFMQVLPNMMMTPFLSYFKSLFKKMSLVLKLIYSIGKLDSNLEIHSWALQCLSVEFIVKILIFMGILKTFQSCGLKDSCNIDFDSHHFMDCRKLVMMLLEMYQVRSTCSICYSTFYSGLT